MNKDKIKIALIDNKKLLETEVCYSLKRIPDFDVIAEYSVGSDFIDLINQKRSYPDVVVIDSVLPDIDGKMIIKTITGFFPNIFFIAIINIDEEEIERIIETGARGFLFNTTCDIKELENAIRTVSQNKYYFSESVKSVL